MLPCSTQKITRAMRPCGKLLRTSHNTFPSERTRGIPIGHENSTSLMSSPINFPVLALKALQPLAYRLASAIGAVEECRQPLETGIHKVQYQFWYSLSTLNLRVIVLCGHRPPLAVDDGFWLLSLSARRARGSKLALMLAKFFGAVLVVKTRTTHILGLQVRPRAPIFLSLESVLY